MPGSAGHLMSYREAIEYLYSLRFFGAKFGLENTNRLAALAGNPQEQLRFIHVAGTNGKGSTCAMLESIYRASGLRVGLFTSPHLISFCERIQVNRTLIPEEKVVELVSRMRELVSGFPAGSSPTFFEVVTVMALMHFGREKCDLVIWETGLGGRLDATNIVTPLLSIITNVQFDHQGWLGNTLGQIAFEKAGIIKQGIPVVCGPSDAEALDVIRKKAVECSAPLHLVTAESVAGNSRQTAHLSLHGAHQQVNAAVALEAVRVLREGLNVPEQTIDRALQDVLWSGRLQWITTERQQRFLLDGAHNTAGVKALRQAVEQLIPERPDHLIVAMLRDKDWEEMCRILAPLADDIYLCAVESERTVTPDELAGNCQAANPRARVHCTALHEAIEQVRGVTLLTGSLYFIGQALELLQPTGNAGQGERGLNEWTGVSR